MATNYTGSIAELMLNSGHLQAQRLVTAANLAAQGQQRLAEIAANAELQRAQNRSALVTNLAQTVSGTLGDYLQYRTYGAQQQRQAQAAADQHAQAVRQQEVFDQAKTNDYLSRRALQPAPAIMGPGDAEFTPPGREPIPAPYVPPQRPLAPVDPERPDAGGGPEQPYAGITSGALPQGPVLPVPSDRIDPYAKMVTPTRDQMLAGQPTAQHREALSKVFEQMDKHTADAQAATEKATKAKTEALATTAAGLVAFGTGPNGQVTPGGLKAALEAAQKAGVTQEAADQIFTQYQQDPASLTPLLRRMASQTEAGRAILKEAEPKFVAAAPGTQFVNPATGALGASVPERPVKKPDYTLGDSRYSGETNQPIATNEAAVTQKAAAAAAARVTAAAKAGETAASTDDTKLMMDGIQNGTLPPLLPGRASPQYVALSAEAARRGFNLAGAVTDWVATQKHINTLNGAQQTRLMQNINTLPELLDSVDTLAKQWDAGNYPVLNKANLELAVNGAYGSEAAQVATRLRTQIADVVADLGTVYMGGNSPTDHALKLAQTALSENWSRPVLTAMVAQARQNVQTRRNSINNSGVQGASEDNPYAPPVAGGRAPLTAPPQAPPGWRYEKNAQGGWTAVQAP